MIESSCHCGKVKLEIDADTPESLLSCNCSACRRYGSLMAYFEEDQVKLIAKDEDLNRYVWGDKTLAFVHCRTCSCYSHWQGLEPKQSNRMGVNARLFTNVDISNIKIKKFDGADTWKVIED